MALVDPRRHRERADLLRVVEHAPPGEFSPRLRDWLLTNWSVWESFREAGDKVRARGLTEYSAYVIVNVLRWRADVSGAKFSLTNTMIPDLARLYNRVAGPLFKTSSRFGKETTCSSAT